MSLKGRISSPLEAGTSILDAHHLPPHLAPALEFASSRLARKSQHITLVVARRDYQLPSIVPPKGAPGLQSPITPSSPAFRLNLSGGPVSALKSLVRSGSYNSPSSIRTLDSPRSGIPSPGYATAFDPLSPRFRWPLSPSTPLSPPPMTPCTASSTTTADTMSSLMSSATFGMRLIHASDLCPKAEKALRLTLEKTEKKFRLGPQWLSPAVNASSCGLTNQLLHSSIVQNEVLFSSEGLTLVTLDHLYSLKSALSSYSKNKSHLRLEDAVDELRRMILANNGAKVSKSAILRSYDWLSVSNSAIVDLDRMYRRAYGGMDKSGGVSGLMSFVEPAVKLGSDFVGDDSGNDIEEGTVEVTIVKPKAIVPATPSPKPLLKLQTAFKVTSKTPPVLAIDTKATKTETRTDQKQSEKEEDGDRTARPRDINYLATQLWNGSSTIDQVISALPVDKSVWSPWSPITPAIISPNQLSPATRLGPLTPNGYDDISPVTRGEWGFLLVDNEFQGGRRVGVEMC